MKRLLIFIAGTLVGAAIVFFVVVPREPKPDRTTEGARPAPGTPAPRARHPAPVPPAHAPADVPAPAVPAPPVPAPPPPVAAPPAVPPAHASAQPGALLIPVAGVKAANLSDTFNQSRAAGRPHEAIDIAAPKGTPVLAVDDGKVVKLFNSKPGGLTVYQFDPGERLAYYYAHLDGYAPGLAEGQHLKRGDLVGYVGSTGNASPAAPHLHFAVFVLEPEKRWWKGTAINPYPLLTVR